MDLKHIKNTFSQYRFPNVSYKCKTIADYEKIILKAVETPDAVYLIIKNEDTEEVFKKLKEWDAISGDAEIMFINKDNFATVKQDTDINKCIKLITDMLEKDKIYIECHKCGGYKNNYVCHNDECKTPMCRACLNELMLDEVMFTDKYPEIKHKVNEYHNKKILKDRYTDILSLMVNKVEINCPVCDTYVKKLLVQLS